MVATRNPERLRVVDVIQNDPRWIAVLHRDAQADGTFYYSVATTGVYCRPSCSARRPNAVNVRFHATRTEAEAAGFRPCRRCRPDCAGSDDRWLSLITDLCRWLESADPLPSLKAMADRTGISPYHLQRTFKRLVGLTPRAYAVACRARQLRNKLVPPATVTATAYEVGFNSSPQFYSSATAILGMHPAEYRQGGVNQTIRFAVGECSLGSVLVACTERGVCAIFLGNDPDTLVRELQDRFPRATLLGGESGFEHMVATVIGCIEDPKFALNLPLDIQGTVFQQRVWQALRTIPPGKTASYTEIAQKICAPKAVRAVAQACAANKLAVVIPCHRVIRNDGKLSGYRWGIERKRKLLERES